MYRIFSMSITGRLYQLSRNGWVDRDGTTFPDHQNVAGFLRGTFVPQLPDGEVMADSYVALVDAAGTISRTYSYSEIVGESV